MSRLRLRPVIEFDPFEYRGDRPSPSASIEEDPDGWSEFWSASLADSGVTGLEPFTGTWVVPAEKVEPPECLELAVIRHFGDDDVIAWLQSMAGPFDPRSGMNADGERIVDGTTALRGGLALTLEDSGSTEVRIAPECCGDLSNWRDWQNATRVTTETWQEVWIGHPTARVRLAGGVLEAQAVQESGEPTGPTTQFRADDLLQAVAQARERLQELRARLLPILQPAVEAAAITPEGADATMLAEGLATHLAGLSEIHLD